MRQLARALLLPNLLVLLTACAMPDAVTPTQPLTGDWGGAHVALTLGAGGGRIEYDCAHGTLDAIVPGPDGAFSVPGTHAREGGPARIDAPPESMRARYDGAVTGDRMTLRVQAGATALGPFVLQRGAAAQLFKCL
jgi:hypothetical protein